MICPCCPPEPTRRSVLWGLSSLPALPTLAAAQPRNALPLIDFHTHLQKRAEASDLIQKMDAAHVARLVLMPLYYGDGSGSVNDGEGSDEQARDYAKRFPNRFVPFVGMQRGELVGQ